ncbi:MAG: hypothetical protein QOC77_2878 [Thermoleophilaceae bacterium]|nr:hypothetical protein [Thermoleophilaceae bacterium]
MAGVDRVRADVARELEGADFMQRLGERVGLSARASAVFGDPVVRDGVTVIPVAKTTWGFGGGSGGEAGNVGSGGGGGGIVSPIGFIEVREHEARFVPIRDLRVTALRMAAAAGVVGWLARRR